MGLPWPSGSASLSRAGWRRVSCGPGSPAAAGVQRPGAGGARKRGVGEDITAWMLKAGRYPRANSAISGAYQRSRMSQKPWCVATISCASSNTGPVTSTGRCPRANTSARQAQRGVLGMVAGQGQQGGFLGAVQHMADACPVNGAGAHGAGLEGGHQRALRPALGCETGRGL